MELSGATGANNGEAYFPTKITKKGWFEKKEGDYRVLDLGRKEILRQFPLLEWRKKPWDGKWRVVMYDLPVRLGGRRNVLRNWLKKLGLGQWQMSIWVSPHPIIDRVDEVLGKVGLREYCSVHESRRVVGVSDKEFARKVWGLDELNGKYKDCLSEKTEANKRNMYELLMADPFLPKELLPSDWAWDKLMRKITT